MKFEIESDIPLPKIRRKNDRMPRAKLDYPWESMRPGDSFFIPVEDPDEVVREMNCATADGNRLFGPRVVSARCVRGGIRVWFRGVESDLDPVEEELIGRLV